MAYAVEGMAVFRALRADYGCPADAPIPRRRTKPSKGRGRLAAVARILKEALGAKDPGPAHRGLKPEAHGR